MKAYGDISGHFRNLILGNCSIVVVGIVKGDRLDAARCPKKAVRNVNDVAEAKWNDLNEIQKRRIVDCFSDNKNLEFGFAKFTRDALHRLKDHYLLHKNVCFPPTWDLAMTGWTYGEILFELESTCDNRLEFTFDHVASKSQFAEIAEHINKYVDLTKVNFSSSHQEYGIQAADCFAGAIAEDFKHGTNWREQIGVDRICESSYSSLTILQNALDNYED